MSAPKIKPLHFILPDAICLNIDRPLPRGAMTPGIEFSVVDDDRVIMRSQFFTTSKRIHGIWHYEAPNQLFFIGYECMKCGEVYLVPDSVKSHAELSEAMQHGCTMDLSGITGLRPTKGL